MFIKQINYKSKNNKSYSKGKLKENIINKTPFIFLKKQNKYLTEKFYNTKEENKNSKIFRKKLVLKEKI